MAVMFPRSVGMTVLAIWLLLSGLAGFIAFPVPGQVLSGLALVAGILLLVGR